MTERSDVTIIGAGMVGTAVACGIAEAGYKVTLVDKVSATDFNPDAPPHIRVSALSYASEQFLNQLGAWNDILSMRACPYQQLAVWEKLHHPLSHNPVQSRLNKTLFDASQIDMTHLGHIVENDITQRALHQQMLKKPGIHFVSGNSVQEIDLNLENAVVKLADGEIINTQLVVGADGALSKVRTLAHIGLNADQYEQQAMVITVAHESPMQNITWQAFTATGPLAYLPLPDVNGQSYGSLVQLTKSLRPLDDIV